MIPQKLPSKILVYTILQLYNTFCTLGGNYRDNGDEVHTQFKSGAGHDTVYYGGCSYRYLCTSFVNPFKYSILENTL